ncbi:MAG: general secretion pathway protein GspK [Verrucomicrobia bacterium]|nr:general secretion pathway protein GspK [Verrucomicrobiota bacterium]
MRWIIPLPAYHITLRDVRQSCSAGPINNQRSEVSGQQSVARSQSSTIDHSSSVCPINHQPLTIDHSSSGMILVTVLLFMAIILALVIQAQVVARMALRFEDRQSLRAQLRVAAAEAAWNALRVLAADDNLQVDHTNEPWAAWQTNCLPNTVETIALITDENRYFNINNLATIPSNVSVRLPVSIVRDVFAASEWPDPVGETQALKDWMDRDAEGAREAGYYHQAHLSLEPPNAPMESLAELDGVLNATRVERRAAPPTLTVLPDRVDRIVPINVNTAGRDVLQAVLGAGRSALAEKICRRRDAHPVTALNQVMDAKTLDTLRPYLDTRSRYFSLAAQAARNGQQETIYALVRRDDQGEIEILRWVYR